MMELTNDLISRNELIERCKRTPGLSTILHHLIYIIRNQPEVEYFPKSYVDQLKWERDIALNQLREIDCELGMDMTDIKNKLGITTTLPWIPCSKKLPEKGDGEYYPTVIITLNDGRTTVGNYVNCDNEWWGDISDGIYSNITEKVVAWMSLPEAYRGE